MLFLNSMQNNIFWKNLCKDFCSCKSQRNAKFNILHRRKWMPDVSPLQNVKFHVPLTFTAAKVFANIFSRKYYFANCLEITLAGAKFWTLCCESKALSPTIIHHRPFAIACLLYKVLSCLISHQSQPPNHGIVIILLDIFLVCLRRNTTMVSPK